MLATQKRTRMCEARCLTSLPGSAPCLCTPLQRYWIKDIDTGNVYVVEAEAEAAARGPLGAGLGGGGRVTELLSGRELRWVSPPSFLLWPSCFQFCMRCRQFCRWSAGWAARASSPSGAPLVPPVRRKDSLGP